MHIIRFTQFFQLRIPKTLPFFVLYECELTHSLPKVHRFWKFPSHAHVSWSEQRTNGTPSFSNTLHFALAKRSEISFLWHCQEAGSHVLIIMVLRKVSNYTVMRKTGIILRNVHTFFFFWDQLTCCYTPHTDPRIRSQVPGAWITAFYSTD
jgi:hypothetical protein